MKMIKQGVDPKTKIYISTCRNCHSEFEYTMGDPDLVMEKGNQREPGYVWFKCLLCGEQVVPNRQ